MKRTLALYTTIYPGVEPYLPAWYRSVREQTDQDFELWIGLDSLTPDFVSDALGADPKVICVAARAGDTPAQVRQQALEQIVDSYDSVVLVDSDDILYPSRVAVARVALQASDVAACALRLVDQQGGDLGITFALPSPGGADAVLPRHNIFGLSNSSFRTAVLRRCLPIPADVVLVDWYLATLAWIQGATFHADTGVGMAYRQHGANTAHVLPPFAPAQVARDTDRVRHHFSRVLSTVVPPASAGRVGEVRAAAADVDAFHRDVVLRPEALERYVRCVNALDPAPYWWSCVAHPALREMWAPTRSQS